MQERDVKAIAAFTEFVAKEMRALRMLLPGQTTQAHEDYCEDIRKDVDSIVQEWVAARVKD